ncbi:ABC transporter ATP-binding protein [Halorubrum cibi]|uniref:ABC-2 type transport system ATP-binding protein n=1 Tax=Halorubrum cibi TaxID=413815 RepID=A0A521C1B6_9EURY|nr:ABC transporter ATP-binding protein [Halorubrum cibi]SMO53252.1 ABC-2 type transport system ATP-binding protein [Halorubrum cibi]
MRIDITDVHRRYGDLEALAGVDFTVEPGDAYGLVGTNGAGKSTLFRLIAGHERPDAGRVEVGGRDAAAAGWRVREEIGFLPEDPGFPPGETGRETLAFHADVRGIGSGPDDAAARIEGAAATVGLADAIDRPIGGYSKGMRRRLGLAAALLANPSVLLLDEPTAGLDPNGVAALREVLTRVRDETNATLLLASHALREVERVCDRVGVVDGGRLLAEGRPDELADGHEDGLEGAFVSLTGGGRDA